MKEWMVALFAQYADVIVFVHVVSAVVWVGGMVALRFAVHPAMQALADDKARMARTLQIMGRFFGIMMPLIALLVLSAIFMVVGLQFKQGDPMLYAITHVKEGLWTVMTINFTIMVVRRNRAEQAFLRGDAPEARRLVAPLPRLMIPTNIVLGLMAIYLGITLRGF